MNPKLRSERFISSKSLIPTESPIPIIGPINGEINIAPIITAVELTFSPNDAMKVANTNTHRFVPLNSIPLRIFSITSLSDALSSLKSKRPRTKRRKPRHEGEDVGLASAPLPPEFPVVFFSSVAVIAAFVFHNKSCQHGQSSCKPFSSASSTAPLSASSRFALRGLPPRTITISPFTSRAEK